MKKKLKEDLAKILQDFEEGIDKFQDLGKAVMVYGSARLQDDSIHYQVAEELGAKLADDGWAVMTGGGPGIMEAVNKGCKHSESCSVCAGIGLKIESEEPNEYMDLYHEAEYFFTRKVLQTDHVDAFIVLPGGIGTMDELFEMLTLISTKRSAPKPIIVLNSKRFYDRLQNLLNHFVVEGTLSRESADLIQWVKTPQDVLDIINKIK